MECTCPSWWNCKKRGCIETAKLNYSDSKFHKESHPSDYSFAGNNVYFAGQYVGPRFKDPE